MYGLFICVFHLELLGGSIVGADRRHVRNGQVHGRLGFHDAACVTAITAREWAAKTPAVKSRYWPWLGRLGWRYSPTLRHAKGLGRRGHLGSIFSHADSRSTRRKEHGCLGERIQNLGPKCLLVKIKTPPHPKDITIGSQNWAFVWGKDSNSSVVVICF